MALPSDFCDEFVHIFVFQLTTQTLKSRVASKKEANLWINEVVNYSIIQANSLHICTDRGELYLTPNIDETECWCMYQRNT